MGNWCISKTGAIQSPVITVPLLRMFSASKVTMPTITQVFLLGSRRGFFSSNETCFLILNCVHFSSDICHRFHGISLGVRVVGFYKATVSLQISPIEPHTAPSSDWTA